MNPKEYTQLAVLRRASLVALILLAPKIVLYVASSGNDPALFSDWDEAYYLFFLHEVGKRVLNFSELEALFPTSHLIYPHYVVNLFLGPLFATLGLKPTLTGLILDFFCFVFAYMASMRLFRSLSLGLMASEVCSLILLVLPNIGLLPFLYPMKIELWNLFYSGSSGLWPSIPIFRSAYTQVSYPLLLLSLKASIDGLLHRDIKSAALGGVFGGLTLYCYFFTWSVAGAVLFFLALLSGQRSTTRVALINGLCFGLCSIPGILFVYASRATSFLQIPNGMLSFGYVSVELFALLIACLLLRPLARGKTNLSLSLWVLSALALAQFSLMNIQQFVPFYLTPYHFPALFLGPIMGGFYAAIFLSPCSKHPQKIALYVTLSAIALSSVLEVYRLPMDKGFQELVEKLETEAKRGDFIVINSFGFPLQESLDFIWQEKPYFLLALLGLKPLADPLKDFSVKSLPGETLSAFYFTGQAQLLGPCPPYLHPPTERILFNPWPFFSVLRHRTCLEAKNFDLKEIACRKIKKVSPQLIVWEKFHQPVLGKPPKSFASLFWESSDKEYRLYRIDREVSVEVLCGTMDDMELLPSMGFKPTQVSSIVPNKRQPI